MKKIFAALVILLAFVSCSSDIVTNNTSDENYVSDNSGIPEPQIVGAGSNSVYILDGLDYLTNLYWKVTIYEDIKSKDITYREIITSDEYRNMTLYTKSSYNSETEEAPVLDLDARLSDLDARRIYTECRDKAHDAEVTYAYKSNGVPVQIKAVLSDNVNYKTYVDRHNSVTGLEDAMRRVNTERDVKPLWGLIATTVYPVTGDIIYASYYDVTFYIWDNSTPATNEKAREKYATYDKSIEKTLSSVLTFEQQGIFDNGQGLYYDRVYTDELYPINARNAYPSNGSILYTHSRPKYCTVRVDGRNYSYNIGFDAEYARFQNANGFEHLYKQNYYDSTNEKASRYEVDYWGEYVDSGDVLYSYCTDINLIRVTIDGNEVTLLKTKTYKNQGYNRIYDSPTYVVNKISNLANTKPSEGDVMYTQTVNVAVKVTVCDNSQPLGYDNETIHTLDSTKTFAENGLSGLYSSGIFDMYTESPSCFLLDDEYPTDGFVAYTCCLAN